MNRRLLVVGALLVAVAAWPAAAASKGSPTPARPPVADYRAPADGPSFMAADRQGVMWAVWSYHRGLEVDIAVSRAVGSTWTAPDLLGAPGVDELDPRIAFLANGTAVVVWWQRTDGQPDRVAYATLAPGAQAWSAPHVVPGITGSRPNLFLSGDELTIGYLAEDGTVQTYRAIEPRFPGLGGGTGPDGGTNGPDPMPGVIVKDPKPQH